MRICFRLAIILAVCLSWPLGGMAQLADRSVTKPEDWDQRFAEGKAAYDREDYRTAITILLPQALDGHPQSQTLFGWMLDQGLGMLSDKCGATIWYDRAARAGDAEAQFLMARSFLDGKGVRTDAGMAHYWMLMAASSGYGYAADSLKHSASMAERRGLLEKAEFLFASTPVEKLQPTPFVRVSDELFDWQQDIYDMAYVLFRDYGIGSCYRSYPFQDEIRRRRYR